MALFVQMEPADQRHTVGVLKSLVSSGVQDRALLKAGLLHDVGKSRRKLTLIHRTLAVLLRAVFGKVPSFLVWQGQDSFWAPFYVLENHPRLGASMLARAGCEERVWRLAELHHAEPGLVGRIPDEDWVRPALNALKKADSEN
jgi:putative nucleotidyltransferase with HDIG domain